MSAQDKLKVALIGAGGSNHGRGLSAGFTSPGSWGLQHARIFATRPDVDFCAIIGRNEQKTQEKADEYGTKGRAVIHDTVKRYTYHASGNETGEVWEPGYFNDEDRDFHRTFDKHVDALLDALKAGNQPPVPAQAGCRVLQLAHAAIQSFETGRRVTV
jgi:predicted dehydrogenase